MKDSASSYILNTIPRKIRVKVSQIIPYPHAHLPNAASFTVTPVHLHQDAVGVEVRDRAIVLEPGPDLGRVDAASECVCFLKQCPSMDFTRKCNTSRTD